MQENAKCAPFYEVGRRKCTKSYSDATCIEDILLLLLLLRPFDVSDGVASQPRVQPFDFGGFLLQRPPPPIKGGKGRLSTDPSFPCRPNSPDSLRIIFVQPSLVTLRDKPTVDKNWHLHQNYPWKYQSVLISDTLQCTEPWLLNLNLIHGRRCLLSHFKCFVSKFSNRQTRGIGESAAQVKLFNWARN